MNTVKGAAIFGALGFFLSFVSGLFSHGSFLRIFFTAFLCALIFAVLGFVISVVVSRLLASAGLETFSPSQDKEKTVGSKVNIVVEDEVLPQGDASAQFAVGKNRQMLKPEDFESQDEREAAEEKKDSGFVPIGLEKGVEHLQGKESNVKTATKGEEKKDETLDELPDLTNLVSSDSKSESFVPDAKLSVSGGAKHAEKEFAGQGAEVMAKAISTVLAHDKES